LRDATSDRTPLTGNIGQLPSSSRDTNTQSYLTSSIPGEDRRATTNTIDESVWETLSRDLKAVWEKVRLVLWPKYLLGGILMRGGGGIAGEAERGEGGAAGGGLGRWPDAETVLQSSMSEGLRDWDLWYGRSKGRVLLTAAGGRCCLASCSAFCYPEERARTRPPPHSLACLPSYGLARPW
jgi:hypothetical protein